MPKLVRDRIPEILQADGMTPKIRQCEPAELWDLLRDKLIEEANELRQAKNRAAAYEELADVLEVVDALKASFDPEKLTQTRVLKALSKGCFEQGFVLED